MEDTAGKRKKYTFYSTIFYQYATYVNMLYEYSTAVICRLTNSVK